jgi:hypothetical protein
MRTFACRIGPLILARQDIPNVVPAQIPAAIPLVRTSKGLGVTEQIGPPKA